MIKVLMVGNSPTVKGGITTVINQFRDYEFQKHGIELQFISTYKNNNNIMKILYFLFSYIKIIMSFIFYKPNIIHIHMSYKGSFTRAYIIQNTAILFHIKNVVHLHGSEFKKWYDSCKKRKQNSIKNFIRKSDIFVVLGENWKKTIYEIEPCANIVVANNTIKVPKTQTTWSNNNFTFLFLGVLIQRKGVHDLLNAISEVLKNNNINIKLLIAGVGKEEDNLKLQCKRLKINKKVEFLGWINGIKKEELLQNSQCMILPSYNEGLPMSILEALGYGMPIISTNVGDISEAVIDGKNGFLITPGDVEKLKASIIKMATLTKEEWDDFSNYSKKMAIKKFSSEKYMNKFIKIYKKNEKK